MYYIDPHIHMISRITDDYERIAQCGCVAVSEPAFWAGFDRGSAEGFRDYFRHLTEIHAAPQRLWTALVRKLVAEDLTVEQTRRLWRSRDIEARAT